MKRRSGSSKHLNESNVPMGSKQINFKFTKTEQAKRDFLKRLGSDLQRESIPTTYRNVYSHPRKNQKENKTKAEDFYSTMEVRSWGSGSNGQLGLGDDRHRSIPDLILALYHITNDLSKLQICCGDLLTAAINEHGHVYVWGRLPLDTSQNIKIPERIVGIENVSIRGMSCGPGHIALVSNNGEVYTWGKGGAGRLGHGEEHNVYVPRRINHPSLMDKSIRQVACGEEHTLLLDSTGSIYSFGSGRAGQLGLGSYNNSDIPILIPAPPDTIFMSIACGMNHSGAASNTGIAYTWGWGEHGRLGHGNEDPQPSLKAVESLRHLFIESLACGGAHSLSLTKCKKVFAWGWGSFGQLGHGNTHDCLVPKHIKALEDVHSVGCGFGHSAAITSNGELYLWGFGEEGQIGTGDESNYDTPTHVWTKHDTSKGYVDSPRVLQVSLGKAHTIAIGILSMQQEKRRKLSPENIRMAATTLQCFIRSAVARIKLYKLKKAKAALRQLEYDQALELEKRKIQQELYAQTLIDAEKQAEAQRAIAAAIQEREKRRIEESCAEKIQIAVRTWFSRCKNAKLLVELQEEELKAVEDTRRSHEEEMYIAFIDRECEIVGDLVVDKYLSDLFGMVHDEQVKRTETDWRERETQYAEQTRLENERLQAIQDARRKSQQLDQARMERELKRKQALAQAEAEHRAKRDREIAEAKAKSKARKDLAMQQAQPTLPKSLTKKELRLQKLKQRAADEFNSNREKREKLRTEMAEQKRRLDEMQREKDILASKLENERHQRIFRRSLKENPTIRPNVAFHVRQNHIADALPSYRVLAGEVKPHYILDSCVSSIPTSPGSQVEESAVRSTSKYRIFRELQLNSMNGKTPRGTKSSEGKRQHSIPRNGGNQFESKDVESIV